MRNKDTFSSYHPAINFLFFGLVLIFTMFLMHPACLLISFGCSVAYNISLNGRKAAGYSAVLLVLALLNPMFNHEGATILTYLPNGNPLTLESMLYGLASSLMLAAVFNWFACYTAVMTSDKFIYLFGRVIPALSLVLSMTLRFVPKFKAQYQVVAQARSCAVRENKLRRGAAILSVMVTWALENAIETADSMKSRGYGLPGRTAFSIYRFDERDRTALLWLLACGGYFAAGWLAGGMNWHYYPQLGGAEMGAFPLSFQAVYLALCLTPMILNKWEDRKWKRLQSEI